MDVIQYFTPTQDDTFKLLSGHKESVFCLDFDSTGKFLASGGQDHIAIIWNATTCTIEFICQGHEDSVNCVSFSPGGDYLSTGDMAGSIRVWLRPVVGENTNEWKLLRTLEVNSDLLWVKWWISPSNAIRRVNNELPNPALLLAGDEQGHVTYWAISPIPLDETVDQRKCLTNTYSWVSSQSALDGIILSSSINTNNPRLIVLHRNGDLRIWDIKTNCILGDIKLFDKYSYLSKQYNADLEVYQIISLQLFNNNNNNNNQSSNTIDHDLLLITGKGFICPVSIKFNEELLNPRFKILDIIKTGDDGSVEALNCSSTHPLYAFGTVTGILGICDAKTNRIRQKWTYIDEDDGQPIGITSLCWSRYRPVFFTATNKGSIVAWCGLTGLTEKISSSSSGLLTEKLPLKVWWGHKAMILYLVLPPFCKSMEDNNNNRIESLNNKEQCIEPFLCTASDDTTVRYFSIDFA
ncbi:POC1 centriolar proteinA [Schistosoma japonicum]|uniref:POC1 centriolar proteinA n=1 Tax=Schistosoma japonicum TaxID=6182 RepID=A0A4Z2D513_SCHJA|nr:POC1 centriolar proteinA [Schistosoma japonicum]